MTLRENKFKKKELHRVYVLLDSSLGVLLFEMRARNDAKRRSRALSMVHALISRYSTKETYMDRDVKVVQDVSLSRGVNSMMAFAELRGPL